MGVARAILAALAPRLMEPKVGAKFSLGNQSIDVDPWGINQPLKPVEVICVQDGWVKFRLPYTGDADAMRLSAFWFCYRQHKP